MALCQCVVVVPPSAQLGCKVALIICHNKRLGGIKINTRVIYLPEVCLKFGWLVSRSKIPIQCYQKNYSPWSPIGWPVFQPCCSDTTNNITAEFCWGEKVEIHRDQCSSLLSIFQLLGTLQQDRVLPYWTWRSWLWQLECTNDMICIPPHRLLHCGKPSIIQAKINQILSQRKPKICHLVHTVGFVNGEAMIFQKDDCETPSIFAKGMFDYH